MSPLAMKYDHCRNSSTNRGRRHTSEIPLQDLYYSKKSEECRQNQRDKSEIPLQDLYLAPHSPISIFSFDTALRLACEKKRWLLIYIQSATMPTCRIINRELWHHSDITDIVSRSFLFLHLNLNDKRAKAYIRKYYGILALDEGREGMLYAGNNIKLLHIALLHLFSRRRWNV